jgi:hypothetical protein
MNTFALGRNKALLHEVHILFEAKEFDRISSRKSN